jgi:hypothetical protein
MKSDERKERKQTQTRSKSQLQYCTKIRSGSTTKNSLPAIASATSGRVMKLMAKKEETQNSLSDRYSLSYFSNFTSLISVFFYLEQVINICFHELYLLLRSANSLTKLIPSSTFLSEESRTSV